MKTIEFLFSDYCSIYADSDNILYLEKCSKKLKVINTYNTMKPYFVNNKVDMVYLGSMSEKNQELAIKKLMPYKDIIKKLIANGIIFLVTGNAVEIFGKYILDNNKKIKCLNIFNYYTLRNMNERHNSHFIGTFKNIKIVGNKSQFTYIYNNTHKFIKVHGGIGSNKDDLNEGVKYKNFYGTQLLGPLLILNPLFTKYILELLGINTNLKYEKEIMEAYYYRLKKLEEKDTRFLMGDHG